MIHPRRILRSEDVIPALLGAFGAMVPLAALRTWVALARVPSATWAELLRVNLGDVVLWTSMFVIGTAVLRVSAGRARAVVRLAYHGLCAALLLLGVADLVFTHVTGSRADTALIVFAARSAPEVYPVFASEVRVWHLLGLVTAFLLAMSPAIVTPPKRLARALTRVAPLVAAPGLALLAFGRPEPARALAPLSPSFPEHLALDAVARFEDRSIPPRPGPAREVRRTGPDRPPNVVIVLLESVGARATSLDDPALGTTPNLARFAAEGLRASNWTTVVPHTSKSIVATMCGTWPYLRAEVREAGPRGLPVRCLPDLLSDIGYRTAFFQTASEEFERRRELVGALGFDRLYARHALARPPFEAVNYFGIEDRAMIAPGVAWSTADLERPFFAVYLTMATHHDYRTPSTWPTPDLPGVSRERARYVHALRYVDAFLGELVDAYARAGALDHTVFVFLGDHGEAFGEHGRRHHDLVIWDEVVRVPMVIWGRPLERRGVATGPRQHIDVLPTVLSIAGAELARGGTEGTSIFADVPADRELFHSCWRPFRCLALRRGDEKIVDHFRDRPPERFDLALDPEETRDRPDAARVEAARRAMAVWRARVNGGYEAHFAAPHPRAHGVPLADWGPVRLLGCVVAPTELSAGEPTWITCRTSGATAWRATLRVDGRVVDLRAQVEGSRDRVVRFALPTDPATALGDHAVELGWTRWSGFHAPRLDAAGAFARVGAIRVVPLPGGAQPPR